MSKIYKNGIKKLEFNFSKEKLEKLFDSFPQAFINHNNEFIIYPKENTYFLLANINSDIEVDCKVLEYASRQAAKGISKYSRKYHFQGIETYFDTTFTEEEMRTIYSYIGGGINREKTLKYLKSCFDVNMLGGR